MGYRVRWTEKPTKPATGYVTDGDQDGDAWEGPREAALKLAKQMRKLDSTRFYIVVPHPDRFKEKPKKDRA